MITPRVRDWHFSDDVPTHWFGGRPALTRFFDNLSLFFPAGERFFIQSVKHYEDRILDPKLKAEVALFIAQEAMHNREHVHYNARLMLSAPIAKQMDRRTARILKGAKKILTPRQQLAVTVALEHLTALMGHFVLQDARAMDGAHPEMAQLWMWHAVEENEHKAVAFDVYKAMGGTYLERIAMMGVISLVFWTLVTEQQLRFMRHDGTLFNASQWRDLLGQLFVTPGTLRRLPAGVLDYLRPGFHPWQLDNRALLEPYGETRKDVLREQSA